VKVLNQTQFQSWHKTAVIGLALAAGAFEHHLPIKQKNHPFLFFYF
jgi:hypothetical protein